MIVTKLSAIALIMDRPQVMEFLSKLSDTEKDTLGIYYAGDGHRFNDKGESVKDFGNNGPIYKAAWTRYPSEYSPDATSREMMYLFN